MKPERVPSPTGLLSEALTVLELPRLALSLRSLAAQPRGRGEPVLVLPGFGAGDSSTFPLRSYLAALGYRVRGCGLGRNGGDVPALVPLVADLVGAVAAEIEQPVRLVGWSLGGYLAREAARERPDAVERVVTLGTPVVGGPKYTAVARAYEGRGIDLDAIEADVSARNRRPLETPVAALHSRRDAIVAWRACIDHHGRSVEHIEVATTHLGFGFSPEVFRIIAGRLARPRRRSTRPRSSPPPPAPPGERVA